MQKLSQKIFTRETFFLWLIAQSCAFQLFFYPVTFFFSWKAFFLAQKSKFKTQKQTYTNESRKQQCTFQQGHLPSASQGSS